MNLAKTWPIYLAFFFSLSCKKPPTAKEKTESPILLSQPIPTGKLDYSDGTYMRVEAKGGLKLRQDAGSTAEVRFLIPHEGIVLAPKRKEPALKEKIDGFDGEWIQIYYEGARGYVFSRFLKPLTEPAGHFYLIKIAELSKLASAETNIQKKASLYDILHKRFLNEGGSPYCSPESDLEHCAEACGRASELRYCHDMTMQGFKGTLSDFQDTVIKAILSSNATQLKNLGSACLVSSQICFSCDGGASVPYSRKVKTIIENAKYISSNGIKKTENSIQFNSNKGYTKNITENHGQPDGPVPFLSVEFTVKDGTYFIENFLGDLVFGLSECTAGL
jgi:hypothetical protein